MSKLFTYIPIFCFLIVLYFVEHSLTKGVLLAGVICLIVFAKIKRSQLQKDDIEYDDRVNANISKWSLRIVFLLNACLILILFIDKQDIVTLKMSIDMILIYLLITLCIPFYIVPTILKRY